MKDQFQPSLSKLANNVPAGSVLLFGDDLAGCIRSLNNITSLMKPTKMISNRDAFGKNPKKLPVLPKKLCLREERALSQEQLTLRFLFNWVNTEEKQTVKIQTDSVGHSPIYDLL